MIRSQQYGNPVAIWAAPADTSVTTVYTATKEAKPVFMGVHISADAGASATVTVTRGANVYEVMNTKAISANDVYSLNDLDIPMEDGDVIKVTDSVGGSLHFAVKILERVQGLTGV